MGRWEQILDYWFDGLDPSLPVGRDHPCYRRWFSGGPEVDAHITREFSSDVEAARAGRLEGWRATPRGVVALILCLDQFPRHIFRNHRGAFESDPSALAIAKECVSSRLDERLNLFERMFLYLPLQHSEVLSDHDIAHERFHTLMVLAPTEWPVAQKFFEFGLASEKEHSDTLRRFGRYPYRNAALGRENTPDEAAYLQPRG